MRQEWTLALRGAAPEIHLPDSGAEDEAVGGRRRPEGPGQELEPERGRRKGQQRSLVVKNFLLALKR